MDQKTKDDSRQHEAASPDPDLAFDANDLVPGTLGGKGVVYPSLCATSDNMYIGVACL